jgi:protein-tyrosine phosphatase|tara:strand:- start:303 stop:1190 length:888 start_codon:yes stop_codon:yes gene_type:complete
MILQKFMVLLLGLLSTMSIIAAELSNLDMSYRRVLPLENGSNFRDAGDYPTIDGKRVIRGELFRSAAMYAIESESDIDYLENFKFKTVVDLRSNEERELQPDRWVLKDKSINYVSHDYSIMNLMSSSSEDSSANDEKVDAGNYYQVMHKTLVPQIKLYFDALLNEQVPVILHCSAGQDRTGFISAVLLKLLGVSEDLIYEDYNLSTDLRRPSIEAGDINYIEKAKTNAFAKLMLSYGAGTPAKQGNPLRTSDGVPFLKTALDAIKDDYGSVEKYLKTEIGLSSLDIAQLRARYTY